MSAPQNVIALVFDFDDTLTDDSTTQLLESAHVDASLFWKERAKGLVEMGWDPALAYLTLLLELMEPGAPLSGLRNQDLRRFGSTLRFYEGLPDFFDRLRGVVAEHTISRPSIEFYIVSGGLEDVIRGSSIARHFTGIWGCKFAETGDGRIADKTRSLFAINKGFDEEQLRRDPYAVNRHVPKEDRRIPWENIIYVGDGLTDVPCFSLVDYFRPRRPGSSSWFLAA